MKNGRVIFAAQEERYTRIKHDESFPINALNKALDFEGITIHDVSIISYYEKPFLKFERIIDTYSKHTPKGFLSFKTAIKSLLSKKIWISDIIKKETGFKGQVLFCEHHESHAASAFYSSPFNEATIITLDGVGEKTTASISVGKGNELNIIEEQFFPHSLGLFYSAITYYCGFKVNSGEYKLMGLAPYGEPKYVELLKSNFITVNDNGSIELNLKHFNFEVGFKMITKSFEKVLGKPALKPEKEIPQFYKDIAASAQKITEEAIFKTVKYAVSLTGINKICLAGGVALNCKANGELLSEFKQEDIWIQPAAGDSGCAIGAAFISWYKHLKNERKIIENKNSNHAYLGSFYNIDNIKNLLVKNNIVFNHFSEYEMLKFTAHKLSEKNVVGWFNGRMEFGPRALGNRSILGSPLFTDMKKHINYKIKKREGFRPFAPIVKEEKAKEWFNINAPSKYMLFTYKATQKNSIPSCVHEDETARVQTVCNSDNPLIYKLLDEFEKLTNVPILINTSFNVRGEPIVESPMDALNCFFQTDMDYLVMEGLIISKTDNLSNIKNFKQKHFELD